MMLAAILKCKPGTRFHLREFAIRPGLTDTADYIHSDVLFGAFISTIARNYPQKLYTYKEYFETGVLKFSSGFYCIENKQREGEIVYLLPKPLSLNLEQTEENKKHKKIKFISKGIWERGLKPIDWFEENSSCHLPESQFVVLKEELKDCLPEFKLSEKVDIPKVRVRTENEEGNLYIQTDLVLLGSQDYSIHWYFMIDSILNETEITFMKEIITLMAASGIGGERSTGCGYVDSVDFRPLKFNIEQIGKQFASLSLTIPEAEESGGMKLYHSKLRGGMRIGNEGRLPVVNVILEGAIQDSQIKGSIVDLSVPGYPSWRYGVNFILPIHEFFCFNETS